MMRTTVIVGSRAGNLLHKIMMTRNQTRFLARRYHASAVLCSASPAFRPLPSNACDVDKNSSKFKHNCEYSAALEKHYMSMQELVAKGGGKRAVERHVVRNKKTLPLERMEKLFDNGQYMELSKLAGIGMPYGDVARAGSIAGN